jgi:hypothetical protein
LIGHSTSRLLPSRPAHTTIRFLLRYLFRSLYLFFIFYVLSRGTPWLGTQRLVCYLHDPRTRPSGFFYAICFVLSIFYSSSIFYLFLSLSRGTPRLGTQRLVCYLHDPRTRPSGFVFRSIFRSLFRSLFRSRVSCLVSFAFALPGIRVTRCALGHFPLCTLGCLRKV